MNNVQMVVRGNCMAIVGPLARPESTCASRHRRAEHVAEVRNQKGVQEDADEDDVGSPTAVRGLRENLSLRHERFEALDEVN